MHLNLPCNRCSKAGCTGTTCVILSTPSPQRPAHAPAALLRGRVAARFQLPETVQCVPHPAGRAAAAPPAPPEQQPRWRVAALHVAAWLPTCAAVPEMRHKWHGKSLKSGAEHGRCRGTRLNKAGAAAAVFTVLAGNSVAGSHPTTSTHLQLSLAALSLGHHRLQVAPQAGILLGQRVRPDSEPAGRAEIGRAHV